MEVEWLRVDDRPTPGPEGLAASVLVPAGSAWLSGHFPEYPVLPGVALLKLVSDCARQWAADRGRLVHLARIQRVRFNKRIGPGDRLELSAVSRDRGGEIQFDFQYQGETGLVARGSMLFCDNQDIGKPESNSLDMSVG